MEAGRSRPAAAEAPAKPAAAPAKVDPSKMSVADILAAARGKGGGAPAAAPPAAKPAPAADPEPAEEAAAPESPAAESSAGEVKSMKNAFKTVDEMLAYCRKVDTK
jgi:hypothetical protein